MATIPIRSPAVASGSRSALRASSRPLCKAISPRDSASPIPRPPSERSCTDFTCENIWKMLGMASALIPMPLSITRMIASPPITSLTIFPLMGPRLMPIMAWPVAAVTLSNRLVRPK